jgi:hypothetical protein
VSAQNGHLLLARVLTKLDRDVHDFNKAFDEMMKYISVCARTAPSFACVL